MILARHDCMIVAGFDSSKCGSALTIFKRYLCDLQAATAIEYALMVAGIGLAVMATFFVFRDDLLVLLSELSTALDG